MKSKTENIIPYVPKINYKSPKGENSLGIRYVSELLNLAEVSSKLTFADEYGQLWQITKVY